MRHLDTPNVNFAEDSFPNHVRPIIFITIFWFSLFAGIGHFWTFWDRLMIEKSFHQKVWLWLFSRATYPLATLGVLAVTFRAWNAGSLRFLGFSDVRRSLHFVAGFVMACAKMGLFLSGLSLSHRWEIAGLKHNYPLGEFFFLSANVVMGVLSEEVFFRGYMLQAVERVAGTTWAIWVSSLLFAVMHLIFGGCGSVNCNVMIVLLQMTSGLLFGTGFIATRSLWLPIGLHFGWNLVWGIFFNAPDFGTRAMVRYAPIPFSPHWGFTQNEMIMFQATLCGLMAAFLLLHIVGQKKLWFKTPPEIRWS